MRSHGARLRDLLLQNMLVTTLFALQHAKIEEGEEGEIRHMPLCAPNIVLTEVGPHFISARKADVTPAMWRGIPSRDS